MLSFEPVFGWTPAILLDAPALLNALPEPSEGLAPRDWFTLLAFTVATGVLLTAIVCMVREPGRGFQDRLVRTYLVQVGT